MDSVTGFPTPASVHSYIQQQEIVRRSSYFPFEQVRSIFRYGASVASTIHYFPFLNRGMEKSREFIADFEATSRSFPSGKVIAAERLISGHGMPPLEGYGCPLFWSIHCFLSLVAFCLLRLELPAVNLFEPVDYQVC